MASQLPHKPNWFTKFNGQAVSPAELADGVNEQGRVLGALILHELKGRFANRALGFLWVFIEPMLHVLVFVALRELIGHLGPYGVPMSTFLITGIVPFFMFRNTLQKVMTAPRSNKGLLIFPQVSIFDTMLARAVLEYLSMCVVFIGMLFGAYLLGVEVHMEDPLAVLGIFTMLWLYGFGFGLALSPLSAMFPSVAVITTMVLRLLYFASGVLFSMERIPPQYYELFAWNPVLQMLEMLRSNFFLTYNGLEIFKDYGYVSVCIILALFVGLRLMRKGTRWLLEA